MFENVFFDVHYIVIFNNKLSWDLFPGAIVDIDYGEDSEVAWGFTYSTRLTINNVINDKTLIIFQIMLAFYCF